MNYDVSYIQMHLNTLKSNKINIRSTIPKDILDFPKTYVLQRSVHNFTSWFISFTCTYIKQI